MDGPNYVRMGNVGQVILMGLMVITRWSHTLNIIITRQHPGCLSFQTRVVFDNMT